jgi:hypothetical protein
LAHFGGFQRWLRHPFLPSQACPGARYLQSHTLSLRLS